LYILSGFLRFSKSFRKARTKSALGLFVLEVNIRDIQGFFCPWPSYHPLLPPTNSARGETVAISALCDWRGVAGYPWTELIFDGIQNVPHSLIYSECICNIHAILIRDNITYTYLVDAGPQRTTI
jgi:hypothetical protein